MDSNWVLVIITAVYVVATILICVFNYISAKASKDQLAESKIQFEESQRLSCQPFLQIEKTSMLPNENIIQIFIPIYYEESDGFSYPGSIRQDFVIKNLGNGNAINVFYLWDDFTKTHRDTCCPPVNAIMHGDTYGIRMVVNPSIKNKSCLCFHYNDLIGNSYIQKIFISIENNSISVDNDSPILE